MPRTESAPALLLDESSTASDAITHVIVHPLVLLHVLDHHSRRPDPNSRVIGTLMGRRDGNTVEVTGSFAVPHAERGEDVAIGKVYNKTMHSLQMRIHRKESIVGWYATNSEDLLISDSSSLIHKFYAEQADDGDPIHLVVDTRLDKDCLNIRAFKSESVIMQGESLGDVFHELRLSLKSTEYEQICLNEMINPKASTESDLQVSIEKLFSLLDSTLQYVNDVVEGKTPPDAVVGRQIADTLATVPRVRPEVFDRLFHDSLQDLLMVTYLSNITKTQLNIAEKLNASLGTDLKQK